MPQSSTLFHQRKKANTSPRYVYCEDLGPLINDKIKRQGKLLFDLKALGKLIGSDSRSINYYLNTFLKKEITNVLLRKMWHIYKEAVTSHKVDLTTAILLVQASGINVTEQGLLSRVYYIKTAYAYILNSDIISKRFYMNMVHSLLNCGSEYLEEAYHQIQEAELPAVIKNKHKSMLDAAVAEYDKEGLKKDVIYSDENLSQQIQQSSQVMSNISQDEKLLQQMTEQVQKDIKCNHGFSLDMEREAKESESELKTTPAIHVPGTPDGEINEPSKVTPVDKTIKPPAEFKSPVSGPSFSPFTYSFAQGMHLLSNTRRELRQDFAQESSFFTCFPRS